MTRRRKQRIPYSPSNSIEYSHHNNSTATTNKIDSTPRKVLDQNLNESDLASIIASLPSTPEGDLARKIISATSISMKDIVSELKAENQNLKDKIKSLEGTVEKMTKRLNDQYEMHISAEADHNRLDQYGRRNNVEIIGIPEKVTQTELENKVISILASIDVDVNPNDIEASHRLTASPHHKGPRKVIVRMINRKKCEEMFKNKHKLKSIDKTKLGINNNIYINSNLNPYFNKLLWNARKLVKASIIHSAWFSNTMVKIKTSENSTPILINHQLDLEELFKDFKF